MIVKMKKVSLVLLDKFREESLRQLREIGVLHLENLEGCGEEYDSIYAINERLKNAASVLPVEVSEKSAEYSGIDGAIEVAEKIENLLDERKNLNDRLNFLLKETERIEPLGDFNPDLVKGLEDRGLEISLYMVNKSDEAVFTEQNAFCIARTKSKIFFALVGEISEELEVFDKFPIPQNGLNDMKNEIGDIKIGLEKIEKRFLEMTKYKQMFDKALSVTARDLEFETVRSGINVEDRLSYLTGFCPVPVIDKLQQTASAEGWGLVIDDPNEDDEVPTQLKLGKVASLLTPITDFLGILPGYREYDISFFFLCFFAVFTAMLIGDAGYGLLFLILTIVGITAFASRKKPVPKAFFLLLVLSVSTIVWGAVSGTWFASKAIMEIGFFQNLKLNAFKVGDQEQISLVMGISFFLGIVQLLIGVVQNFIKNFPKRSSFAQIGWFAVLVAIYYLVLTLVVERAGLETYPTEMLYVLLGGVIIIFVFGQQEEGKSFIKGILSSFSNFLQLFLDVVGTFSDIMSYVRLFAVGLASVKIAETFNQLGAQMSDGPIIIFGILIVLIGHSINIVLGLMAILVHAVRLNILEYSGKVGVEWSGFKYEPFRVNTD